MDYSILARWRGRNRFGGLVGGVFILEILGLMGKEFLEVSFPEELVDIYP